MTALPAPDDLGIRLLMARTGISREDAAVMWHAKELLEVVRHLTKNGPPRDFNGDWACVECKPHSDMLIEGFQCAYHRGLSLVARVEGTRPEEG